jgi:methylmalonyl-CoA/ethylmalonyl-CoA epimerase
MQKARRILEERGIPTFGFSEDIPGWKELFIHPREAFGTLIQFAEFNPLDWINPGYIPPSYREFTPPQVNRPKGEKVEVCTVETEEGLQVEIRQEGKGIRFPRAQLEHLIQALKDIK